MPIDTATNVAIDTKNIPGPIKLAAAAVALSVVMVAGIYIKDAIMDLLPTRDR